MSTIRNNPEGLLLLAAGCALLMRSGSRQHERQPYRMGDGMEARRYGGDWTEQNRSWAEQKRDETTDRMAQTAESARHYGADLAGRASEATSSFASSVSDYAAGTGRTIAEGSTRMARQAQSGVQDSADRLIEDQPLAVPLIGLAAGAALAAIFPASNIEKRTLGPAGERMTDAAEDAGRKLRKAAGKAEQRLEEAADEHGLNKEGLKEVAGEAADAFSSTFSGKEGDSQASSTTGPASPSTDTGPSSQSSFSQTGGKPSSSETGPGAKDDQRGDGVGKQARPVPGQPSSMPPSNSTAATPRSSPTTTPNTTGPGRDR
jgi:hypothetical protein